MGCHFPLLNSCFYVVDVVVFYIVLGRMFVWFLLAGLFVCFCVLWVFRVVFFFFFFFFFFGGGGLKGYTF